MTAAVIIQRESNEFRAVTPRDAQGVAYVGGWHYQITLYGERPVGTWLPSVSHAGKVGFSAQGLARGTYLLWVQIDDDDPFAPIPKPVAFSVA